MAERELLVRILGDDRDLQRALGSTNRKLEQIDRRTATFGRNVGRAFAAAGVAIGTVAILRGANQAVDAAVAVNEEISKSRQVFGDAAEDVLAWSRTTADAFGISQRAALQASGTFGNLLQVTGILPGQAADMSKALVELAADLASFNNADPTDVLQALRSGLIGEAEPLRRFGVLLSEARVQQLALEQSGKQNVRQLTNQEKALARYQIILKDTTKAQGDFRRTSESLANQSRILDANLQELSANMGRVLVPTLTKVTGLLNATFDAFDRLNSLGGTTLEVDIDVDLTDLIRARNEIRALTGENDLLVQALDETIRKITEAREEARGVEAAGPGLGIGSAIASEAKRDAEKTEQAALEADRAQRRSRRAFDAFIKGQGLKLDRAALTKDLSDDLAVLRAIEAAILRRIQVEGRTFELVEQLVAVRSEIARTVDDQAAQAKAAGEDAFAATVDALNLDLDMARATKRLDDDLRALRALESAILRRIATEGRTTDLMRQLFQVRQEQKAVAQQLADQQREARRSRQFKALGLTAEGDEPAPSVGALSRRRRSLEEQIKGTTLDTKKNRQLLENIAKVLAGQFGKVGRDVRLAIERMLDDIAGALESGDKRVGPLTKTTGLNTKKLLAGLGLSPEEINELRGRLSSFNASQEPAGFLTPRGKTGTSGGFGGIQGTILVESYVTVELDGEKVGRAVTRSQQKTKRRNPQQKRGPNRGL